MDVIVYMYVCGSLSILCIIYLMRMLLLVARINDDPGMTTRTIIPADEVFSIYPLSLN